MPRPNYCVASSHSCAEWVRTRSLCSYTRVHLHEYVCLSSLHQGLLSVRRTIPKHPLGRKIIPDIAKLGRRFTSSKVIPALFAYRFVRLGLADFVAGKRNIPKSAGLWSDSVKTKGYGRVGASPHDARHYRLLRVPLFSGPVLGSTVAISRPYGR